MSAASKVYSIKDENSAGEPVEHTSIVQYSPPEDLRVKEILIMDHTKSGKERYKIVYESEEEIDLISKLEENTQVDLVQDAELSYLTYEEKIGPGTKKDYAFLSEEDLEKIEDALQIQIFLDDIELVQHNPPKHPISDNAIENMEIDINVFSDKLERDKKDICSNFLEKDDLEYIEETLEHYRESIKPKLYNRDKKIL